jgi:hypothetical protein
VIGGTSAAGRAGMDVRMGSTIHARFCLSVYAFNSKNHARDKDSNGNGWFKSGFSIVVSRRKPNGIQTQSPKVSRVLADTDTIFFWKDPDIAGM